MKQLLLSIPLILTLMASAQVNTEKKALLLIDIQEFYFPGGKWELSEPERAAENAALLLEHFREEENLVVHVRHNSEPGGSIHPLVRPVEGETVVTKEEVNCFRDTGLLELLQHNGITSLVICGMQTHMCLEAATRAAADYGFQCTVIGDGCATRDLTFGDRVMSAEAVHYSTLSTLQSYAEVTDATTYLTAP